MNIRLYDRETLLRNPLSDLKTHQEILLEYASRLGSINEEVS